MLNIKHLRCVHIGLNTFKLQLIVTILLSMYNNSDKSITLLMAVQCASRRVGTTIKKETTQIYTPSSTG